MLRTVGDLRHFTIRATDENLGSVRDGYFDDRNWTVRYVVVQSGKPPSRRVLVAPVSLQSSKSNPSILRVGPTTREIADDTGAGEIGASHLRAVTALIGYAVQSEDGEIGHVEDVLIDDRTWAIRYLVVNAEKWCPDRTILVSPEWLTRVTWDGSNTLFSVVIALTDGPAGSASSARRTPARRECLQTAQGCSAGR